ncbi:MAG TPA: uroporphyrinogen-III C-methyltransferase [Dehalococcoidia bacterium]|nr:uroporphyrinogen-III C-methyltransferase [Dehalococcoidia bacterium]
MESSGQVWLVGAGPGDPGLITVAGLRVLRRADVVVYDRLAPGALLREAPKDALLVDVGKAAGSHTRTQAEINALLIENGLAGRRVVRLKGGDPFVFGRGGEEVQALAEAGVPCTVVPGVTSALAGPAAAGIPATHRGVATNFAVLAAQGAFDDLAKNDRWRRVAALADTAVILMGAAKLEEIASAIVDAGRPAGTPSAVIEQATMPFQRVTRAPLGCIASAARKQGVSAPAVLVVGDVTRFSDLLPTSTVSPLVGCRVVVTRPADRSAELCARLLDEGATPVSLPLLKTVAEVDEKDLGRVLAGLREGRFRWLTFTSATAVREFFVHLHQSRLDARVLGGARVLAVGSATSAALSLFGIIPDLSPDVFTGADAARALVERDPGLAGAVVLFPRAAEADPALSESLRSADVSVSHLILYRTERLEPAGSIVDDLSEAGADAVLLASPSAAGAWSALLGRTSIEPPSATVCVGPTTAKAARRAGLVVNAIAEEHTSDGLVSALVGHFAAAQSDGS